MLKLLKYVSQLQPNGDPKASLVSSSPVWQPLSTEKKCEKAFFSRMLCKWSTSCWERWCCKITSFRNPCFSHWCRSGRGEKWTELLTFLRDAEWKRYLSFFFCWRKRRKVLQLGNSAFLLLLHRRWLTASLISERAGLERKAKEWEGGALKKDGEAQFSFTFVCRKNEKECLEVMQIFSGLYKQSSLVKKNWWLHTNGF